MAGTVDTSVLFAAIEPGDPHHQRALETLARQRGLEVAPTVLAETELLARKRAGRRAAIETLGRFLSENPHVGVLDADLHPEAHRIWTKHAGVSYTDAHAIAAALHLGDSLLTFDARQESVWRHEAAGTEALPRADA